MLHGLLYFMWLSNPEIMYAQRSQLEKVQRSFHGSRPPILLPLHAPKKTSTPIQKTAASCRPAMRLLSPVPVRSQIQGSMPAHDISAPSSQSVARRLAKVVANYVVKGELDLDTYFGAVQEEIEELLEREDSDHLYSSMASDSPLSQEHILHLGPNYSENA